MCAEFSKLTTRQRDQRSRLYIFFRLLPCAFCLLLSLAGCATYHFGNASLFPPDISTVYVPMAESHSFRPDLGEALTEAIDKQIEKETPYRVVGTPNADSVLTVKLIQDTKRVIDLNKFDEARATEVNYQVQVTWINRKGDVIYNGVVPLPPEFTSIGASQAYIPEYGQSYSSSEYAVVQKLAKQVVGLMERPW
ncbi:MAG TPA: LptE family protein [Pirellulales bacterium]|nr:LptE family protein [Pirellulales bacterium]